MEDNEVQISKYSSGVNINLRIDQLWKDSHLHSRINRYSSWNLDLDCIWSELARDLNDKDDKKNNLKKFKEIKEEYEKFDKEILKFGIIKDKQPVGFKELTQDDISARNNHYRILREKQIFLARLENKLGKGTTYDSDDEDLID